MSFINPELSFIKYRKRKIKIVYKNLDDCYGLYDPNKQKLYFERLGYKAHQQSDGLLYKSCSHLHF